MIIVGGKHCGYSGYCVNKLTEPVGHVMADGQGCIYKQLPAGTKLYAPLPPNAAEETQPQG
jgi:hypothetical protein